MHNGELGFWWQSLGGQPPARPSLQGPLEADVAIVGGGFTGLWTAWYLRRAQPQLRVVVLERERAGWGASGRNGGWVSGFFSGPARAYDRRSGAGAWLALQRAMFETVGELAGFLRERGAEADLAQGGVLEVALNEPQLAHLRARMRALRALGLGEEDLRELSRAELADRVAVAGARGALHSPHVARVHPAKLVLALTGALQESGVEIYEHTPVAEIRPHLALTAAGPVRARWVVRATEGYTAELPGLRRRLAPLNSSMIITTPLPEQAWARIGWAGAETMSDGAHAYAYLQRTADGRIAIGGRGVPYRYGSRTGGTGTTPATTVRALQAKLLAMFPDAAGAALEHAWSGVLGVPRDWCASLGADRRSGLAWAGGYVGEGLAAANLAARALCDLLLERDTPLTRLAWVGRTPRAWEPEPLRWIGIRGIYALYRAADRAEARRGRSSRLAEVLDLVSGRA